MFGQEAFPGHLLLSLHPDSLADNPDQPFILVRSMVRRGLWRRLPGRFFLWRGPFWVGGWLPPLAHLLLRSSITSELEMSVGRNQHWVYKAQWIVATGESKQHEQVPRNYQEGKRKCQLCLIWGR